MLASETLWRATRRSAESGAMGGFSSSLSTVSRVATRNRLTAMLVIVSRVRRLFRKMFFRRNGTNFIAVLDRDQIFNSQR